MVNVEFGQENMFIIWELSNLILLRIVDKGKRRYESLKKIMRDQIMCEMSRIEATLDDFVTRGELRSLDQSL